MMLRAAVFAAAFVAAAAQAAEVVMKQVDYAAGAVRWQRQEGFAVCRSGCPDPEQLVESQAWRLFRTLGSVPAVSPQPAQPVRASAPEEPARGRGEFRLYFCFDSADPPADAAQRLSEFVEPGAAYDVLGYASPEGPGRYNLELSRRRAEAAAGIVKAKGGRLRRVEGLGEVLFDRENPATSRVAVIKKAEEVSR